MPGEGLDLILSGPFSSRLQPVLLANPFPSEWIGLFRTQEYNSLSPNRRETKEDDKDNYHEEDEEASPLLAR